MATWEDNYLAHYGVPKMKWGVRRYQNTDGSLTELGKKHYGKDYTKKERPSRIIRNFRNAVKSYEKTDASRFKGQLKVNRWTKKQETDPSEKRQAKIDERKEIVKQHETQMNNLLNYQGKILSKAVEQHNTRKFKRRLANIGLSSEYFNKVATRAKNSAAVKQFLKEVSL